VIPDFEEGIPTYQDGVVRRRRPTLYHELADIVHAAVYLNGPLSFRVSDVPEEVEAGLIITIEEDEIITIKIRDDE